MPHRRMVVLSAMCLAAFWTQSALAHAPKSIAKMPLLKRLEYQKQVFQHAEQVRNWFAKRKVRLTQSATPVAGTAAYQLWWHIQQQRWIKREIAKTERLVRVKLIGDENAWLCIFDGKRHGPYVGNGIGEGGSWTFNTGNDYYGGLQMDLDFQRSYGPPALGFGSWEELLEGKGTADHWTPDEQMIVAEYARRSGRGYYPWPNTARYCGLI